MADDAEFRITIRRDPAGAAPDAAPGAAAGAAPGAAPGADPGAAPVTYTVDASGSGGSHRGTFTLPFSQLELDNYILRFSRTRRTVRKIDSPEMTLARTFGGTLFQTLITGDIGEGYQVAQGIAQGSGKNLRVTLSLTQAPELAVIPWEFLYDDPSFLAMSKRTPIVRYLDVEQPARPYEMQLPLRILAVESMPEGVPKLATGSEKALLTAALKSVTDLGAVVCDWLEDATLGTLNQRLRAGNYHILHFIGHGGFDEAHKEGALLFEDANHLPDLVGGDRLATIVGERESLRLVVLNSCEGARSDLSDPFSGVAGRLIERDLPAVIGMQFEITDRAAILFAREFYTVLAEGKPVDTAVSEARLAILADQNDVEWATPALFMRGSDAHLFSIANAVPIERVVPDLPDRTDKDKTVTQPATLGERLRALVAARPLLLPLLLAVAGILLVAGVAWVLILQDNSPTLAAQYDALSDRLLVQGTGFKAGETVDLAAGDVHDRLVVATGGIFSTGLRRPSSALPGSTVTVTAKGDRHDQPLSTQVAIPTPEAPTASPTDATPSSAPPAGFTCQGPDSSNPSILFLSNRSRDGSAELAAPRLFCIDSVTTDIAEVRLDPSIPSSVEFGASSWGPSGLDIAATVVDKSTDKLHDISILTSDGLLQPLSPGKNDDFFPSWSIADEIAFARDFGNDTSNPAGGGRIMVVRRVGTPVRALSGFDLKAPVWSPDGKKVAFFGRQEKGGDYDIGVIDFGTAPVDVSKLPFDKAEWFGDPELNDRNPVWSPDGRRIAFVRGGATDDTNDIYVADAQLSNPVQLTGKPTDAGGSLQDGNPAWSPDGSQIVFYRANAPDSAHGFRLWIMNADGTGQSQLMATRGGDNLEPSWRGPANRVTRATP